MKESHRFAYAIMIILLAVSMSVASPCGKSGMTVVKADDGSGYVIYGLRKGTDFAFSIPGSKITFPDGTTDRRTFVTDGIHYENKVVDIKSFAKSVDGLSTADILKRHKEYESKYLLTTTTPLTNIVEYGLREKPAIAGQPTFSFYLWAATDPKQPRGTRQYFLTTVSEGDVVILSSIVRDASLESVAILAFQRYAASFQHILKKEQCPETKNK